MLDIIDKSILDSLPFYHDKQETKTFIDIGCGEGRLIKFLRDYDYIIYGIDIKKHDSWKNELNLYFSVGNIFDLNTLPIKKYDIVMCSQVLEHLKNWKAALNNLISIAKERVIITVPWNHSFDGPNSGHVNFWTEKNINEFNIYPYSCSFMKIRTKPEDKPNKWCWLIIIDKNQCYG